MKLIMTLVTRNEDDILRYNIDYHKKMGVDFFIVTNHKSNDNTDDILNDYQKQGFLEHRKELGDSFLQAKWVTDMVRSAAKKYKADWVINNDTDEFWYTDQLSLKESLQHLHDFGYGMVHVNRYDFYCRNIKNQSFYQSMVYRESVRKWTKCCHVALEDAVVEEGNHQTFSESLGRSKLDEINPAPNIEIFHYPVRSKEQFYRKMYDGTKSMLLDKSKPEGTFWHWKNALRDIEAGRLDEHYRQYCREDIDIQNGIANQSITLDDRLSKKFSSFDIK